MNTESSGWSLLCFFFVSTRVFLILVGGGQRVPRFRGRKGDGCHTHTHKQAGRGRFSLVRPLTTTLLSLALQDSHITRPPPEPTGPLQTLCYSPGQLNDAGDTPPSSPGCLCMHREGPPSAPSVLREAVPPFPRPPSETSTRGKFWMHVGKWTLWLAAASEGGMAYAWPCGGACLPRTSRLNGSSASRARAVIAIDRGILRTKTGLSPSACLRCRQETSTSRGKVRDSCSLLQVYTPIKQSLLLLEPRSGPRAQQRLSADGTRALFNSQFGARIAFSGPGGGPYLPARRR